MGCTTCFCSNTGQWLCTGLCPGPSGMRMENTIGTRNLSQKWKFPHFFYAPQLVLLKIDLKSSSNTP